MLLASTVLYQPDAGMVTRHLVALGEALHEATLAPGSAVVLRDHSSAPANAKLLSQWQTALGSGWPLHYHHSPENPGYGMGHNHNFAAHGAGYEWFLALNPDLFLRPESLQAALGFAAQHPSVGLIAPTLDNPDGLRPACFRPPGALTLLLRALGRTARDSALIALYECRDWPLDVPVFNPPLCSGCCMLLRRSTWQQLGGFDPAYFLYFEDFALSAHAARMGLSAWCPGFVAEHSGGGAGRKGFRHWWWFLRSALRYRCSKVRA